jgi:hypothetical protein
MEAADKPDSDDEYVSFGYFDPLVGRRIMKRLSDQQVRLRARDVSRLDMANAGVVDSITPATRYPILARNNRIELFIHTEDQSLARTIMEEP